MFSAAWETDGDMRLPWWVVTLGYCGLVPFWAGPLWVTFSPETLPSWLDRGWWLYVAMVATFLAGTFWGFALPAAMGLAGAIGIGVATLLMGLIWSALMFPFEKSLGMLTGIYLLLLAADFWRERMLGTVPCYFSFRTVLTLGAVVAIVWRAAQLA